MKTVLILVFILSIKSYSQHINSGSGKSETENSKISYFIGNVFFGLKEDKEVVVNFNIPRIYQIPMSNFQNEVIELTVSPNPVSDIMKIELPDKLFHSEYSIINFEGQIKMQGEIMDEIELDMSELKSGTYFLHIQKKSTKTTVKFIIVR